MPISQDTSMNWKMWSHLMGFLFMVLSRILALFKANVLLFGSGGLVILKGNAASQ